MTTPDDPLEKRLDSVGRLMPHVEAKVIDVHDRSRILPIGEEGELVVSGYVVMKGYWGDKERTEEVRVVEKDEQSGGEKVWMHTGDEASMDKDGYVKITGRIKDLIIRGGENIHPLEVENVLFAHPSVSEVSVVGLPDEKYGECVAAFVIPHTGVVVEDEVPENSQREVSASEKGDTHCLLTRSEIRTWVRKRLSHHLVPKYIFWAKEYPKTASGKIQKFKLQEEGIRLMKEGKGL
jgi:acyl-CoA synthetase (AMP-forming)/AMP-acid ligase II